MTLGELIETVLEGIAEDMIRDQQAKHMRASGASASSFEIKTTETDGQLFAASHWYWQIHGRKPGPFKNGIAVMLDWIKRKGITPKDTKTTLRQLAYLFARKISLEGNDIFKKKRPGIDLPGILKKWRDIARTRAIDIVKQEITQALNGNRNNQ
jgi:hypothetical protein